MDNAIVIDGDEVFDFVDYAINSNDIEFRNCDFYDEDIEKLSSYKSYNRIAFLYCTFENKYLIKNIKTKSLSFTNSKVIDYGFISNMTFLENLTIVGGKVDILKINNLFDLEYLRLSNSTVYNIEQINLNKLKYLFIDNTNIDDISFINKLPSLELISLSNKQILNNKQIIDTIENNIKIIIDSEIGLDVDDNE